MEFAGNTVICGKNIGSYRVAAVATARFVLGNSDGNVCAQNNGNQISSIITAYESRIAPRMFTFETSGISTVLTNPPAIFIERFIGKTNQRGIAPGEAIIQVPVIMGKHLPFIRCANAISIIAQDEGILEKVTITDEIASARPDVPNSVTLWDEIAPPVPARTPATSDTNALG